MNQIQKWLFAAKILVELYVSILRLVAVIVVHEKVTILAFIPLMFTNEHVTIDALFLATVVHKIKTPKLTNAYLFNMSSRSCRIQILNTPENDGFVGTY